MKNGKYFLRFLFMCSLILLSCSESAETDIVEKIDSNMYNKDYIRTANIDEQLDYVSFHMAQLVGALTNSSRSFDQFFLNEESKNGGFGMVLVEDLIRSQAFEGKGGSVDEDIEFSLGLFEGLSEEELEIFIEKIKDGNSRTPIFLMSTYDTEQQKEVVVGFKLNDDRKLLSFMKIYNCVSYQ